MSELEHEITQTILPRLTHKIKKLMKEGVYLENERLLYMSQLCATLSWIVLKDIFLKKANAREYLYIFSSDIASHMDDFLLEEDKSKEL